MAKYTRYDQRNKKKDRRKDQLLDKTFERNRKVRVYEPEISDQELSNLVKDYR